MSTFSEKNRVSGLYPISVAPMMDWIDWSESLTENNGLQLSSSPGSFLEAPPPEVRAASASVSALRGLERLSVGCMA